MLPSVNIMTTMKNISSSNFSLVQFVIKLCEGDETSKWLLRLNNTLEVIKLLIKEKYNIHVFSMLQNAINFVDYEKSINQLFLSIINTQ